MYGDIFHNSVGNYGNKDVFGHRNATGITGTCTLNLPYPPERMQILLDQLSVARKREADAKQERDLAYKDWADCKRKLFCNASPKNSTLNEKEKIWDASRTELARAENELKQANEANKSEQTRYEKCRAQEKVDQAKQAEIEKQQAEQNVELKKVSTANIEAKKDYALYGLIAVGVVSTLFFGYKLIKN